jgi:hypothetical protein
VLDERLRPYPHGAVQRGRGTRARYSSQSGSAPAWFRGLAIGARVCAERLTGVGRITLWGDACCGSVVVACAGQRVARGRLPRYLRTNWSAAR